MLSFRAHRFVAFSLASIFMLVQSAAPWLHQGCQHDHSAHSHSGDSHAAHSHALPRHAAEAAQHSHSCRHQHDDCATGNHCHSNGDEGCQSETSAARLTVDHTHSHDTQHDCAACRLLALSMLPAELVASSLVQPVANADAACLPRNTLAIIARAYLSRGPPRVA